MTADEFNPQRIVQLLNRHQVEYVLVGGYAAQLHGARRPTYDVDITPSTTVENLHRLSEALRELGAGIRVDDLAEGLPFDCTAESLRGARILNLRTPAGDLDLTFVPAGFPEGYEGLVESAQAHTISGVTIKVAALNDVIKSKTAAARPKDLDALPELLRIAGRDRHQDLDYGLDL
jgi:hypothetical protein